MKQRHTKANPCLVCAGWDGMERGQGKRCSGFRIDDDYDHCSREELAGSLEREDGDTYAHRMHGPCNCGQTHGEGRPSEVRPRSSDVIVAEYDYQDASGRTLFQVIRREPKDFRQRRPNPIPSGSPWIYSLEGVQRVPYRLPELLAATDRPVYVVEGEKDVDAMRARGFVATCNPGGAGKWKFVADAAAKALEGREVIIVADADAPGRAHAADVLARLQGVAKSVRVVEPPAPHKDVSDMLDAGLPVRFEEQAKPDDGWSFVSVKELSEELKPVEWLCEGLRLAPGAVTMVAGYGYSRKTMALQSLALAVAGGRRVWDVFTTDAGRVVHLDYEQGRRMTQERYQRLARGMGFELRELDDRQLLVAAMPRRYLATQADVDSLLPHVDGAKLVIVDSLLPSTGGADENSSDIRKHLDMLTRLSERSKATLMLIHHAGKPPSDGSTRNAKHAPRGSSALFDACQTVYVFTGEKNEPTVIHHEKDRLTGSTLDSFAIDAIDVMGPTGRRHGLRVVHLEEKQVRDLEDKRKKSKDDIALAAAKESILERLQAAPFEGSKPSLQAAIGGRRDVIYRAIDSLVVEGRVVQDGGRGHMLWRVK